MDCGSWIYFTRHESTQKTIAVCCFVVIPTGTVVAIIYASFRSVQTLCIRVGVNAVGNTLSSKGREVSPAV